MADQGTQTIKSSRWDQRLNIAKRCYLRVGAFFGAVSFAYNVFHLPKGSWDLIVDGYPSVMAIATLVYSLGLHFFSAFLMAVLWLPSFIWYVLIQGATVTDWLFYAV